MPKRTKCEGTGQKPVVSQIVYPACPVCGQEFSAAGRKHRWNRTNIWLTGIPAHYRVADAEVHVDG